MFRSGGLIFLSLLISSPKFFSQNLSSFPDGVYESFKAGFVFNHPIQTPSEQIKRVFAIDPAISFSLRSFKNHWGWSTTLKYNTQSFAYKRRSEFGPYATQRSYSSSEGCFSMNVSRDYNLNLTSFLKAVISIGPTIIANTHTDGAELTTTSRQTSIYNTNPIGFGMLFGANFIFKAYGRKYYVLNVGYTRGFIKYREAFIEDMSNGKSTYFYYYGSGPFISTGVVFRLNQEERKTKPK